MKELKCRIYDYDNEKMIYSHVPEEQGKREYYPIELCIGFSHWDKNKLSDIMLCLNTEDKNGKEIYENDIITENGVNRIVEYCNACCQYELVTYKKGHGGTLNNIGDIEWGQLEIIGNKYENKNLIAGYS